MTTRVSGPRPGSTAPTPSPEKDTLCLVIIGEGVLGWGGAEQLAGDVK